MTIALRHRNITVDDVDEAIAFSGDALGLQVRNDVPAGGFRRVTLGTDTQAGLEVVLSLPHAGRRSDDVDATFEPVRASGADIPQAPMDQPWGPRDCALRDPSGNTVRIAQAPAA